VGTAVEKKRESSKVSVGGKFQQKVCNVEEEVVGVDLSDHEKINIQADFSSDEDIYLNDKIYSDGYVSDGSFSRETELQLKIVDNIKTCDWTQTLLKNGCHNLSFMDLLSLEVHHSSSQLDQLKKIDRTFKTGWLHDEVINSYFYHLSSMYANVLYCGSTEALLICSGKSFRNLWKNINYHQKNLVLIPFNYTGTHWMLVSLNVTSGHLSIIDPMRHVATATAIQKSKSMAEDIMQKKFRKCNVEVINQTHVLQNDAISCGVLTCFYAEQLAKGI